MSNYTQHYGLLKIEFRKVWIASKKEHIYIYNNTATTYLYLIYNRIPPIFDYLIS